MAARPRRRPAFALLLIAIAILALAYFVAASQEYPPAETLIAAVAFEVTRDGSGADNPVVVPGTQVSLDGEAFSPMFDYPSEGVLRLTVGPIELAAGTDHVRVPASVSTFPFDGFLHGFDWKITHSITHEPAPDRLLHHVNIVAPETRELFAPMGQRLVAAGNETGQQVMPGVMGRPFARDEMTLTTIMLQQEPDRAYSYVHLHVTLYYSKRGALLDPVSIQPFYMDVMSPLGTPGKMRDFPVPPGRSSKSWEGSPSIDGRILGLGGHLHDYGTALRLEDVTRGEIIWEASPVVTEAGEVVEVPSEMLFWSGGVKIYASRSYRLTAEYDNPMDEAAPHGGMGALGGLIIPSSEWPSVDASDPAYLSELSAYLSQAHDGHGGYEPASDEGGAGHEDHTMHGAEQNDGHMRLGTEESDDHSPSRPSSEKADTGTHDHSGGHEVG